jgi:hypothetical protein
MIFVLMILRQRGAAVGFSFVISLLFFRAAFQGGKTWYNLIIKKAPPQKSARRVPKERISYGRMNSRCSTSLSAAA